MAKNVKQKSRMELNKSILSEWLKYPEKLIKWMYNKNFGFHV